MPFPALIGLLLFWQGDTTGSLDVSVVDSSNRPVPGVRLALKTGGKAIAATQTGENGRARFVQQLAAAWYYYFDAAAETFEQDYLLTAKGLVPDGTARRSRNMISLPQAKERVKGLLHDYFTLAKSQSRPTIAPEFLTCFEQLVELAPDFGQGHYNVGCMHALMGNHQQAVASVKKALAIEPKYRKIARKDPDLATVLDDPDLVQVLGTPGK